MTPNSAATHFRPRQRAGGAAIMAAIALLATVTTGLMAHHGRDFITLQDAAIPGRFDGVLSGGYEWSRDGSSNEYSSEPSVYVGLLPRLAMGYSHAMTDAGNGLRSSGATPQMVLRLTPEDWPNGLRAGLWLGYEFAQGPGHNHASGSDPIHSGGSGPDAGAPSPHRHDEAAHAAVGTHRHGESGLHSRLMVERNLGSNTRALINLVQFTSADGGKPGFGYGLGLRQEWSHDFSTGLECSGDFQRRQSAHQALVTAMLSLRKGLSLRLGAGGGITRAATDLTLHSSLLWRF